MTLRRYRRRSVLLPSESDLRSTLSTLERQKELEKQRKEAEEQRRKDAEAKLDLYKRLNLAVDELTKLSTDHLQNTPQQPSPAFTLPGEVRPVNLLVQEVTQRQRITDFSVERAKVLVNREGFEPTVQRTLEGLELREATKSATSYSQDVTERSAHKITERVLERTSLRVTNEVIEKNTHSLNNEEGDGHISGVYQWINKVYQAQMFNYGIRMMYDFMVPEPGRSVKGVGFSRSIALSGRIR